MGNPFKGIQYFFNGFGLVFAPGLRRYMMWPLLINIILFAILGVVAWFQFSNLLDWLLSFLPGWLDWLRFILWPLFFISTAIIIFFTFSLVANLIAAPFNALLSAAVERKLTGRPIDEEPTKGMVRDAVSAIGSELRKLSYFLIRAIPLGILFLIPVLQVAAPFLWILFGAWMLVIEYADYPLGNHQMAFKDQHKRLKQKRLLSLGFGGTTMLATMIPLLNFLVMPAAVAGATRMAVEQKMIETNQSAEK